MKSVNGLFIQPTEDQLARVWTAVAARGYPMDSAGVLALLMEAVDAPHEDEIEEEPVPNVQRTVEYLMENPEQIAKAVEAGKMAFGALLGRLKKKQ